jgi:hypothetical protein
MRYMNLNMLYNFIQVLISKRKHPIKDDYFSIHMLFTTIYLLQKQKLNRNNYYEQKINMVYFIQPNEHDMIMHANIQYYNMPIFL